jgi:hypothetical protein
MFGSPTRHLGRCRLDLAGDIVPRLCPLTRLCCGCQAGDDGFDLHRDVYRILLCALEHQAGSTTEKDKVGRLWKTFLKVRPGYDMLAGSLATWARQTGSCCRG